MHAVKRVPLGFAWPPGETWSGYLNPWPGPTPCAPCGVTGLNKATKRLLDRFGSWAPRMTKAEMDELLRLGHPPDEIEALRQRKGCHNPLLRHALVGLRAKRKGLYGACLACGGEGFVPNVNPAVERLYAAVNLYEEWEPVEPPSGPGWQLWIDRNGPVSPVFPSSEALAEWCAATYKEPFDVWSAKIHRLSPSKPPQPRTSFRLPSDHFRIYDATKSIGIA